MNFSVCLTNEQQWVTERETWIRGFGFINGDFHTAEDLLTVFGDISSQNELKEMLEETNGFFAVIRKLGNELIIAADQIRSIPLFYAKTEDGPAVGTNSHQIASLVDCTEYDQLHEAEYSLTGYVAGSDTLCENVYQVQAGEVVSLQIGCDNWIDRERHYRYRHMNTPERSPNVLLDELDSVTEAAFKRLITYANGRPIVVNMSAGYDSRLLVSMLTRLKYDNIIAFTYEYSGDEKEYCKEIANRLDIQWEYVNQTHQEWNEWYQSAERKEIDRAAGILDAVPTIGPAVAMKKLHEEGRIPEDAIFVTGDSASTTGDHIPPEVMKAGHGSRQLLASSIVSGHYEFWEMSSDLRSTFEDRVCDVVGVDHCHTRDAVADAFEYWDWQERQAKHILRTYLYDYWDYDFWYPLWDREFMDFWTTVPLEHRFERSLFERYVRTVYADVADLSMDAVRDSFHERSPWVSSIEKALSGTPLKDPVEQIYRQYISPREYENNPIWGIMRQDQFDRLQSGRQVIHAFRVLELLGRMSFSPPTDGNISKERSITLELMDRSRSASPLISTKGDAE